MARYWLRAPEASSERPIAGEVREGGERGREGALAGVVELAGLGHQLAADHPDSIVGAQPGQRRVEGAGVDLGVGIEQQDRRGAALPQGKVVGGREADVLAADQAHLGELALDHVGRRVGAAAVDHGDPRPPARRVLPQRSQAAPQQVLGAVADDDDLEVERSGRHVGLSRRPSPRTIARGVRSRIARSPVTERLSR